LVPEEFLEVAKDETTDTTTTTGDEELTDSEKKKFGKFLNQFLEEDDTPTTSTATTSTTPQHAPTLDIEGAINKALDAREGRQKTDSELVKIRADVEALKPKAKSKWSPWTLFSG
jgi:hypothetical protein